MTRTITRSEIQTALENGSALTFAEALPDMYYRKAHLPGAVNLPHDRVDELAPTLFANKNDMIVVYCANKACPNSGIAGRRLTALGYTNVFVYEEGKDDWIAAGLAVEAASAAA